MILFLSLTFILVLTACNGDQQESQDNKNNENEEEQKTISIGLDPYDYATVPAYLSKEILEQEGYEVKIEEGQIGILYEALANEEIDAFIDIWSPNLQSSYLKEYEGQFDIAGTLYSDMPIGVAVPTYMEDVNSIADLNKYKEKFDKKVYAIDPGSGMADTTKKMVEAYDMNDFEIKNSSTAAMLAQAESVMKDKEGIVFNAWRPHPMFVRMDIKFLDDPKNVWKLDDVQVGVTSDLKKQSPTAYTLFSNMKLTLNQVEQWIMEIDTEGKTPEELAETWVEENQGKVNKWLEK
ncbi:glycine betaine/proline transport system substrate-binding protein [Virgibacillus subterraneus]|uniref:Glycine betaine/proline transport system substrate-binding protein n=2 Tax=Virgibacillus TaxID=84406 RepID=A0A1H1F447_9BACI|nr:MULTISPECIES: glycine betaine ABC transporter substrate-binding protein [Virgibacillus]SDQ95186.1 glycine betaine/proline transport system substrate-binding protein [Virgibacillus salinus]SEQ96351.1 glycine betaine/proline transport system substrate-binding protein [Virgibacillus subterraneus]